MILAGDLGGTKTLLAIAENTGTAPSIIFEKRYASREYGDFSSLLRPFLEEAGATGKIDRSCLAVAGPVENNRSKVTYLPWLIDGNALAREFGIDCVMLTNDFAAAARGVEALTPADLVTVQAGSPIEQGIRVVVGAGTGLGVAALVRRNGGWDVIAGEGGHVGFAPADEEQVELWRFLRQRSGVVSAERILSGAGLVEIYRFLRARHGGTDVPDPLRAKDPAAAIGIHGLAQPQSLSSRTLDLFVHAYGAFAGDLALLFMARGGVYLAGGIAPKILPRLRQGGFLPAFSAKAEHAALMPGFPVHVVINEKLGLIGAINAAARYNT
jgi:glucokinase